MKNAVLQLRKSAYRLIAKNHVLLLSFFLPVLILELAYAVHGIFPFSKWDLLIIDLYHQYAPFISDLQDKLRSLSSLLFSWDGGLGTNYLPLFGYYLASPLNLLTVLFPKSLLTEAVLFLTLTKVGLAGACFAIYLRGVHGKQNLFTVATSLLYALSGFVLTNSWNIMWLDTIYLLPLVVLGLVKLVRDDNCIFYCITLAITLFANFYMAFFVCLFLVLYYPVCLAQYHSIKTPSILVKKTIFFTGYSLLAGGLSAILLLPTFFALRTTSAAGDVFPKTLNYYYDLFDFITRHFTFPTPSIREGMPNINSGIIVLILLPVYFMSRSVGLKEKLWHLGLMIVLILSFNMNMVNFIWHGFHYPNQIPYRFSFVYIFLVLSMCYKGFESLKEYSGKQIGTLCFGIFVLVLISQKFDDLNMDYATIYASMGALIVYAAMLTADRVRDWVPSRRILVILLAVIVEVIANTILTINNIDMVEGYSIRDGYSAGKEVRQIRSKIAEISSKDRDFYRMELMPPKTTNDPYLYNYRGLSFFTSTASKAPVKMLQNLGFHTNTINSCVYEGSTPVLDSFFGIKYLIYRNDNIEESLYKKMESGDEIIVYENPYALPVGIWAPAEFKNFRSYSSNPMDTQNNLMNTLSGVKNILTPIDQKQGTTLNLTYTSSGKNYYSFKRPTKDQSSVAKVQIIVEKDQQVYLYYKSPSDMKGSAFVKIGDKKVDFNPRHSTLINLGFCRAGTIPEIEITFDKAAPETGRFEVYSYTLDVPAFENAISTIKARGMAVDEISDTGLKGTVYAEADGIISMSVLYNKGWHVRVDGKEVEAFAIDDCLLGFDITQGTHTIEIWFVPEKFHLGLIITLASLVLLAVLAMLQSRRKKAHHPAFIEQI